MALLAEVLFGTSPRTWISVVLPTALVLYWIGWIIYARTLHPLASVPGPFWASISRTWLMWRMHVGDLEIVERALHAQHGPLIRIAPDEVASNDPAAIPLIFPIQRPLEKTVWYLVWRPVPNLSKRADMFTSINEKEHAAYRKIVGGVYAMSNILRNEDHLDDCVNLFMKRLREFADRKEEFDFGLWLEMYAFDVIGAVFFGKQFGFLENSHDYGSYIQSVHRAMPFLSVVAMTPHYFRPILMACAVTVPKLLRAVIAVGGIRKIAIQNTNQQMLNTETTTSKRHDILAQLLTIVHEKGEKVNLTHNDATAEMWTGIMAGADSTSISLRAIFYYMMKHPETLVKAQAEIDAASAAGILSTPVKYNEAVALPYLSAVVKEATRLFPSFQVSMQRYSPKQGIELSGKHIPAGFRVGMNPGVVQHDKGVFGLDADKFNPERWLESEERSKAMDRSYVTFGVGTRTCTGKHLAMTEIFKVTSEILRHFTPEMAHDRPWKTHNATFVMQSDVICRFKRRTAA
ncbi:cytochrome P450 [Melanomma pulvis-pyrius CBS 109.77]|uniref:Cytochrome P450 n=1 Tax=Melanomma pulvis-pyrius CBS 109.77 TaxID=1314802 RepID=A0A6A6XXI6_9PLEO|nr:cytochrome P450 [Melanomma pulvis-pyrius CBS 109.77]